MITVNEFLSWSNLVAVAPVLVYRAWNEASPIGSYVALAAAVCSYHYHSIETKHGQKPTVSAETVTSALWLDRFGTLMAFGYLLNFVIKCNLPIVSTLLSATDGLICWALSESHLFDRFYGGWIYAVLHVWWHIRAFSMFAILM